MVSRARAIRTLLLVVGLVGGASFVPLVAVSADCPIGDRSCMEVSPRRGPDTTVPELSAPALRDCFDPHVQWHRSPTPIDPQKSYPEDNFPSDGTASALDDVGPDESGENGKGKFPIAPGFALGTWYLSLLCADDQFSLRIVVAAGATFTVTPRVPNTATSRGASGGTDHRMLLVVAASAAVAYVLAGRRLARA